MEALESISDRPSCTRGNDYDYDGIPGNLDFDDDGVVDSDDYDDDDDGVEDYYDDDDDNDGIPDDEDDDDDNDGVPDIEEGLPPARAQVTPLSKSLVHVLAQESHGDACARVAPACLSASLLFPHLSSTSLVTNTKE